jgi:hypothetical protein
MKLNILTGRIARPQKAVIYGPEGIGKSILAAQFPAPVFLDTEGGTHHVDVARLPAPKSWAGVTAAVQALSTEAHEFKSLVIDTADWLEKLLVDQVCKQANKSSIEDFGYGKGYVVLAEEFAKFLASLDALLQRGMHIVFLAHTKIVKFEQPDAAGAYDRYELKLSKRVGPLVKEWCDLLLFGNSFTKVAENDNGRRRGVGGRERKVYTMHSAAWDAKDRHGFDVDAAVRVRGHRPSVWRQQQCYCGSIGPARSTRAAARSIADGQARGVVRREGRPGERLPARPAANQTRADLARCACGIRAARARRDGSPPRHAR